MWLGRARRENLCAGGFAVRPHNNPIDQFAVYDPVANKWQTLAPLPMALGSMSLAGVQGKISRVGWTPRRRGHREHARVYDPTAHTWTMLPPFRSRDHLGVVVVTAGSHHRRPYQ